MLWVLIPFDTVRNILDNLGRHLEAGNLLASGSIDQLPLHLNVGLKERKINNQTQNNENWTVIAL